MKYAKENGWDPLGIEPGASAVQFSKSLGVNVIQDSIYNILDLRLMPFDVVYSNQTFEHLVYPNAALEKLAQIIRPEGLLFLTVANDFNPIQKIATEKLDIPDWWFIPPEHVNYFNPESITRLLEQSGYEILDISTTFPIDIFLLMGDNYVSDPKIGKKSHLRRKV